MTHEITREYTTYWLFQRRESWFLMDSNWDDAVAEFAAVIEQPEAGVTVRGVYNCLPFEADVDIMIWAHSAECEGLERLATRLDQTVIGRHLRRVKSMIGVGGMSMYDKTHAPSFMKQLPGLTYMSVYPFIKTHAWYQLSYEQRRELMIEHGRMGQDYPDVLTNTTNSFGAQSQEFIVALEGNTVNDIVVMSQKLREAEVRLYTAVDTPIWLGVKTPAREALEAIRGQH